jgi:amino acid transporter
VAGFVLAYFVDDLVVNVLKSSREKLANLVGAVAKWAIIVFTVLAALIQLNVASQMIQMLFTAIVFMLAVAFGLAFGLGGKDAAKDLIEEVKRDIK